jgi:hypothetical protein
MKICLLSFALLGFSFGPAARGTLLYDNTASPTFDTIFYSGGQFVALGDQIQLASAGTADGASVELFNNGPAGTFDAELDLFTVGSPVGTLLGSSTVTGINTVGLDVLDFSFNFATAIAVPQNLIFTITLSNQTPGLDLGVDMFEPPTVGSSDNTFMIAATAGPVCSQFTTNNENVYFQLTGDAAAPEPSSVMLLGAGLLIIGIARRRFISLADLP